MTNPTRCTIAELPAHRRDLAYTIVSDADLPVELDSAIRNATHDFEEGVRWGLAATYAYLTGCTQDEAFRVIR